MLYNIEFYNISGGGKFKLLASADGSEDLNVVKETFKNLFNLLLKYVKVIDTEEILSKGKQQKKVKARSLFCYWAVKELEISLTELSRRIRYKCPRSWILSGAWLDNR